MKVSHIRSRAIAIVCVLAWSVVVHASDIQVGTWKADVAKSTFSPGPPIKAQLSKIEPVENGIKLVSDRTNNDGSVTHIAYTVKYDGKDYPVAGDPGRDAVSSKRIDDFTIETLSKKGGKVTTTLRIAYAHDGQSRTETATGTDPQGRPIKNVVFWNKQ